ncbi:MAG: methylmalonyl-CoA mutase subunit beta [Tetrasphaera sp.]|nr:methylmalonyl-CoA mutase subunit beta [Tetrasphaera sp.]
MTDLDSVTFAPQTRADWQRLVAAVLNKGRSDDAKLGGEDAEAALRTTLAGGLDIEPLYLRPDSESPLGMPGRMPFTRGLRLRDRDLPWDVRQHHDDPDVAQSRAAVLADLENGVSSLWIHLGVDGIAPDDLAEVLADVQLDLAEVAVSAWDNQVTAAKALLAVLRAHPGARGGNLGHDPIGACSRDGASPTLDHLIDAIRGAQSVPGLTAFTIDTRVYHDTGADVVDELAFALATGVAYLRRLEEDGVGPAEAFGHIRFRTAATADQFLTIAKVRALRRLWARVGELSGVGEADRGAHVHAVTSLRMLTRDDPWVNILRSTIACFAAAVGGADAITVLPHDTVAGLPDGFSRRLARNTQALLAQESHVAAVTDPAGGSWYVESLTSRIAEEAWGAFQDLERGGGIIAALANGTIADLIAQARSEADEDTATRRAPITGVSMFPNPTEPRLERRPRTQLPAGPGALRPRRDAIVFEALRDRAAAYAHEHGGQAPSVTVRTLGTRRDFGARELFVNNLLAAAGVHSTEEAAPVAILASNTKGYASEAAAAVAELRAAGTGHVLVAGRRKELPDGVVVDGDVHNGMDIVTLLHGILDRLGAPAEGVAR